MPYMLSSNYKRRFAMCDPEEPAREMPFPNNVNPDIQTFAAARGNKLVYYVFYVDTITYASKSNPEGKEDCMFVFDNGDVMFHDSSDSFFGDLLRDSVKRDVHVTCGMIDDLRFIESLDDPVPNWDLTHSLIHCLDIHYKYHLLLKKKDEEIMLLK